MGYVYNCDICGDRKTSAPPLMGQFTETFLKTSDSLLVERFDIDQTVTICRDCAEKHLL